MNNKGFTLVELLASMVILGMLMAIIVPNTVGILRNNKANVYLNDAKKLINNAKYRINTKNDVTAPYIKSEEKYCTIIGLAYLDNSNFDTTPNGGCYDVNRSFVLIAPEKSGDTYKDLDGVEKNYYEYKYYVQLVEYKDGKYYGLTKLTKENYLTDKTKVTLDKTTSIATSYTYNNTSTFRLNINPNTINETDTSKLPNCDHYNKYINSPDGREITKASDATNLSNEEKICAN